MNNVNRSLSANSLTHEDRLTVARDLAQRILKRYGDAVLGITLSNGWFDAVFKFS